MTLDLRQTPEGIIVPVRVVPRSSRTQIDGVIEGALWVKLAASPVDGAANRTLLTFMADSFSVRKSDLRLASGDRSKQKSVLVHGISRQEVMRRLGFGG